MQNAENSKRLQEFFCYVIILPFKTRGYGSVGRAMRSQRIGQGFESPYLHHLETTGLIQKISVLFSFLRAILLILGLFCLNLGKVVLFYLLFFVNLYL